MDLADILQQQDIRQLRQELDSLRRLRDLGSWDLRKAKSLVEENLELKLRLALLLRLLISKGVITAEEFASLLAGAARTP
jgi:hypothetical protein